MASCGGGESDSLGVLRLATTTSTRDSGLLERLLPVYEESASVRVDVIAVGTGAALKIGQAGDADVLIVHARQAELEFVERGYGRRREDLMFNYFVILGPRKDPAGILGMSPPAALARLRERGARFISRGDDSGTHKREMALWNEIGGLQAWPDYLESGQGMGATVIIADEKRAYVLSDEGSFAKCESRVDLVSLVGPQETLRNPYGVIVVDPERSSTAGAGLADSFADFLISSRAQAIIGDYEIDGRRLFHPAHPRRN